MLPREAVEAPALRRAAVKALSQSEGFLTSHVRLHLTRGQDHGQDTSSGSGWDVSLPGEEISQHHDGNAAVTGFGVEMTFLSLGLLWRGNKTTAG